MRIMQIRSMEELEELQPIWRELETASGTLLFQSWSWNLHWCRVVLAGRKHLRLKIRVVEDGTGRVQAIIPLFEARLGMVSMSHFLGHQISCHNNILLRQPESAELAQEVIRLLVADLDGRNLLHLKHLDQNSIFTRKLRDQGLAELLCTRLWVQADPGITDQYQRLGKRTRKNTRCSENKLRREHGLEFITSSTGAEAVAAMNELVNLHHRRFALLRRRSLLSGRNLRFIRSILAHPDLRDRFEVCRLRTRQKTIAAILLAHDPPYCFPIITGFDMNFAEFSPLRILISETMRRSFDELGHQLYDLGSGYQEYKFRWNPVIGYSYHACLGFSASTRLFASLYSSAFKRTLPVLPGETPREGMGDQVPRTA